MKDFAGFCYRRRKELGLTQEAVAQRAGLKSAVHIGLIEKGKRSPSKQLVLKLADALEESPARLFLMTLPDGLREALNQDGNGDAGISQDGSRIAEVAALIADLPEEDFDEVLEFIQFKRMKLRGSAISAFRKHA